jgi:Xaa-Pro aminopeptidase
MAGPSRKGLEMRVFAGRRRAAARRAAAEKVHAVLVSRPEDVGYLSGFTGDDSFLLLGDGWSRLITDGRYGEQAREQCPDVEVHVRKGGVAESVAEALKGRRVRRLGVQGEQVTVQFHKRLVSKLPTKRIKPLTDLLAPLRAVKDDGEVRAIRKAVRVAEKAFREVLAMGVGWWVGKTERDLAAELDYRMRLAGAEGPSFNTIVAVGPHGARPHHQPGSAKVRRGTPVLIDWGARVAGYCSDLTRVVFVGRIPPRMPEVYEAVRRAQAAAIAAARPGVGCKAVDAAARRVIDEAGYGEQFLHSLGHGLGRQVHEFPGLGRKAKKRLRAGMVVTFEPGIYLPGFGGVRIEDDVVITRDGCRRLSSLPRDAGAMRL